MSVINLISPCFSVTDEVEKHKNAIFLQYEGNWSLFDIEALKNLNTEYSSNDAIVGTEYVYGGVISSVIDGIISAIQKIIDYTRYVINNVKNIVKKIIDFDKHVINFTNIKQNRIVDWLVKANASQKDQLNKELKNIGIKKFLSFDAFKKLLENYANYSELLSNKIFKSILNDIKNIEIEKENTHDIKWLSDNDLTELSSMGILITRPKYSVKSKSPFNLNSEVQTLESLKFDKYDHILTISKIFATKSYPSFIKFKTAHFELNHIQLELDKKKRYFKTMNSVNRNVCFSNISSIQKQLNLWSSLFACLATLTYTINNKRQIILNTLIEAIDKIQNTTTNEE